MSQQEPVDPTQLLSHVLSRTSTVCGLVNGAAVATSDGLALALSGELCRDEAPAAAAFLMDELDAHLGLVRDARAREMLVWTERGPWYLARVGDQPFVLALAAEASAPAGLLRHAGQLAIPALVPILAALKPSGNTLQAKEPEGLQAD